MIMGGGGALVAIPAAGDRLAGAAGGGPDRELVAADGRFRAINE
jgi:hypothetical protein